MRARSGLMVDHPVTTAGDDNSNNSTVSLSGRTASGSPVPATLAPPTAAAAATRAPASVPVLAITCGAVGGVVALAVILALLYVRRIRRRVKSMKRRTNVLGPGARLPMGRGWPPCYGWTCIVCPCMLTLFALELAAPMSPSQLSQSTTDSSRVTLDGMRVVPPRKASDLTNLLPPLSASLVSSPTSIEHPSIPLQSPVRPSSIIVSIPPAARRSSIWAPDPRSPMRSSHAAAVPWPLLTSRPLSDLRHGYEGPSTSSDTAESHA